MHRENLLALGIMSVISVSVVAGYRSFEFTVLALAGIVVTIAIVSTAMMRLLAVSEGIVLLEATVLSLTAPLLFERSLLFELVGVAVALAFTAGLFFHLALDGADSFNTVPTERPDTSDVPERSE